jgi:hypothetical protein
MKFLLVFILFSLSVLLVKIDRSDVDQPDLPGLDTANYHAGLYLPKGFTATVWAESPQFYNPTNMDVDAKGRVWVTEAVNYRNYNNEISVPTYCNDRPSLSFSFMPESFL